MNKQEIIEKRESQYDIVETESPRIEQLIYVIRNKQVMIDADLAKLYNVETGALNRAVKRNIDRFPEDFRFQLSQDEYENLKCQFGISSLGSGNNGYGGRRTLPSSARLTAHDIANFNAQYPNLEVKHTTAFHDRFMIIDGTEGYHIGASLKDAGKKCFAINKIEDVGVINDLIQRAVLTT